jgi:hypothetical protein
MFPKIYFKFCLKLAHEVFQLFEFTPSKFQSKYKDIQLNLHAMGHYLINHKLYNLDLEKFIAYINQ